MSRNSNDSDSFAHILQILRFHGGEMMPFCFTKSYVKDRVKNGEAAAGQSLQELGCTISSLFSESAECRFLLPRGRTWQSPGGRYHLSVREHILTSEIRRMARCTVRSGRHRALATGHLPHGEWSRLRLLPYLPVVKQPKGFQPVPAH